MVQAYSKGYAAGWAPQILLILAPIVSFKDLSGTQISALILLVILGYFIIKSASKTEIKSELRQNYLQNINNSHALVVIIFSFLSLIGCYLVSQQQESYLDGSAFDNLQTRYIALVDASLQGNATSSILSSLGNLARSFFFIAITSFVVVTTERRSTLTKLLLGTLVLFALAQNFQVSVSRLQLVFYLICGWVAAVQIGHPILRRKAPIIIVASVVTGLFLVSSTMQRFEAMYGNSNLAAEYMQTFFGVEMKPLGNAILDHLGVAVFTLSLYIAQGIPELLRLMSNNASPYSMGGHSLYLLLSPPLRIFGVNLGADTPLITNQGSWWGLMGDLYLDFGVLFPIAYLVILYGMVRIAIKYGNGPVYGLAFRALTIGMIFAIPYIGIFNTYSVSYVGIAILAAYEQVRLNRLQLIRKNAQPQYKPQIIRKACQ